MSDFSEKVPYFNVIFVTRSADFERTTPHTQIMQPILLKTLLLEVFEYDLTRNKSESIFF